MTPEQLMTAAAIIDLPGGEPAGHNRIWLGDAEAAELELTGLPAGTAAEKRLSAARHGLPPNLGDCPNDPPAPETVMGDFVGESPCMKEVFSLIRQVAPTSASVLITGETGTGKELAARAIHNLSLRREGPFVALNCAALPESLVESMLFGHERGAFSGAIARQAGCFEQAHNGTLLLDEISDMPMGAQAKLLRVLEESTVRRLGGTREIPVSARVLAAANRPPEQAVESGNLRRDLYHRLNVFHISLPPLRQHPQDIAAISGHLIARLNQKHGCQVTGISREVLARLMADSWPGNVRQLRNRLERAVILARKGVIELRHLPAASSTAQPVAPRDAPTDALQVRVGLTLSEVEETYVRLTFEHVKKNKRRAAALLGICRGTLKQKLRTYERPRARSAAAGSR